VIYPVLEWLLRHMSDLKERAYLARYLVKVDIPQDFMIDPQIAELYEQVCVYEQVCCSMRSAILASQQTRANSAGCVHLCEVADNTV